MAHFTPYFSITCFARFFFQWPIFAGFPSCSFSLVYFPCPILDLHSDPFSPTLPNDPLYPILSSGHVSSMVHFDPLFPVSHSFQGRILLSLFPWPIFPCSSNVPFSLFFIMVHFTPFFPVAHSLSLFSMTHYAPTSRVTRITQFCIRVYFTPLIPVAQPASIFCMTRLAPFFTVTHFSPFFPMDHWTPSFPVVQYAPFFPKCSILPSSFQWSNFHHSFLTTDSNLTQQYPVVFSGLFCPFPYPWSILPRSLLDIHVISTMKNFSTK